jgi:hypothetical protein
VSLTAKITGPEPAAGSGYGGFSGSNRLLFLSSEHHIMDIAQKTKAAARTMKMTNTTRISGIRWASGSEPVSWPVIQVMSRDDCAKLHIKKPKHAAAMAKPINSGPGARERPGPNSWAWMSAATSFPVMSAKTPSAGRVSNASICRDARTIAATPATNLDTSLPSLFLWAKRPAPKASATTTELAVVTNDRILQCGGK